MNYVSRKMINEILQTRRVETINYNILYPSPSGFLCLKVEVCECMKYSVVL